MLYRPQFFHHLESLDYNVVQIVDSKGKSKEISRQEFSRILKGIRRDQNIRVTLYDTSENNSRIEEIYGLTQELEDPRWTAAIIELFKDDEDSECIFHALYPLERTRNKNAYW